MTSRTEIAKYRKENQLLKKEIEEQTGKTVERLYEERAKRIRDAIELREPDRVPFLILVEPHRYSGILNSAACCCMEFLARSSEKDGGGRLLTTAIPFLNSSTIEMPTWKRRLSQLELR